ncbi:Leupeptin-inactivating enzyme 2 [Actinoplanes sp. SE50]|uniref:M4 family metallopeptidase n=1 Tax=unclassified Actinoplanes TaxID=2626549 RepID=UPI00023EC8DB|nr:MULTISPECIES: M4 family metallopeptidase [unclassified Actinoplanes]AEV82006.1 Leupeptin-inactivating enzyme 2 [Actinoplanes sp. SE50/110]ATO80405.1 Leupeptin-inactivating enzyme 2 [Actinoplanes sp. SE50]SLL97812.1 Leupeptin-inactivating enzyme 2 [Actinoplanes sp. SE50/110]
MRSRTVLAGTVAFATGAALAVGITSAHAASPPQPAAASGTPVTEQVRLAAADKAAASGFDALGKGPDDAFLRRQAITGLGGYSYLTYDRTYRGLPVVGGDATVVVDAAGHVRDTFAADHGRVSLGNLRPAIPAKQAVGTARRQLDSVATAGQAQLVVYALGAKPLLAYQVLVSGVRHDAPSRLHVWVDAGTGKVLFTREDVVSEAARGYVNGAVQIDTNGGVLQDPARPGLSCGNYSTRQTYRNGGTGTGTDLQTACVDAYYGVEQEWNMLRDWLGRSGISGNGSAFPLYVGLNDVNAYWGGSSGTFGHNSSNTAQATSMDVVGHEMGHAIDQYTGAGTAAENGLGEGTGDIFGALTEHYADNPSDPPDYTVGEEINLVGSGPIRYMYNPSTNGDPNCYSSSIPGTEVHSAAGPLNHWFYLLAEGSRPANGNPASPTCDGSTVNGVSIQKAGQIFMSAMNMKTSGWSYAKYRGATVKAAVNLFGASSAECASTKAAWSAVSVGPQSGEPSCTTVPAGDFSLAVNPSSGSLQQGGSTTTTVSTQVTGGTAQSVTLTASGLPSGVTATFSPATVTAGQSATLTLRASATATTGSKAITITGTAPSGSHTATYTTTVTTGQPPANDFSVSVNPASATVAPGNSVTASVVTATAGGSAQTVNLAVSGAPTGVTAAISPASVTSGGSATLTVSVSSTAAAGTFPLTVTGTGTAATRTATYTLTVSGGTPPQGCGGVAAWSATRPYVPGDKASYNGHLWNSTWYSTGAEPGAPGSWAVWTDAGPC